MKYNQKTSNYKLIGDNTSFVKNITVNVVNDNPASNNMKWFLSLLVIVRISAYI
jgi:hypothetical protein